jgi:hypothetical protein
MPKSVVIPEEKTEEISNTTTEKPGEGVEVKPAYKPRFNMKNIPPKPPGE